LILFLIHFHYLKQTLELCAISETLASVQENKIKILKAWNQYLLSYYAIEKVDLMDKSILSLEDFNTFRVSISHLDNPTKQQNTGMNTLLEVLLTLLQLDFQAQPHHNRSHLLLNSKGALRGINRIMRSTMIRNNGTIGGENQIHHVC